MLKINWEKLNKIVELKIGVIPVIVQDHKTKDVLILVYVNKEALKYSIKNKLACFWSTSRNKLWIKGNEESGNFLKIIDIKINCENNSLLYLVKKKKQGVCHNKNKKGKFYPTCFYRSLIK